MTQFRLRPIEDDCWIVCMDDDPLPHLLQVFPDQRSAREALKVFKMTGAWPPLPKSEGPGLLDI